MRDLLDRLALPPDHPAIVGIFMACAVAAFFILAGSPQ